MVLALNTAVLEFQPEGRTRRRTVRNVPAIISGTETVVTSPTPGLPNFNRFS